MTTNEIIENVYKLLRENETLSTHEQITIEDAIDCGAIDACDIFDDFLEWCSENQSFSYNQIQEFKEDFSNLLTYKENVKILEGN